MKSLALLVCWIALASAKVRESSPDIVPIEGGINGTGHSTYYWDCCVPACSSPNISAVNQGVTYCLEDGETKVTDYSGTTECSSAEQTAYVCSDNTPWIVNSTLAYGFTGASFHRVVGTDNCCKCFLLSFQGALSGKHFLVQITNKATKIIINHFDIQIPGAAVGLLNGCQRQWGVGPEGWGVDRDHGVTSAEECSNLPSALQDACRFRWEFLEGVENPDLTYQQVECPVELTSISGCQNVNDP